MFTVVHILLQVVSSHLTILALSRGSCRRRRSLLVEALAIGELFTKLPDFLLEVELINMKLLDLIFHIDLLFLSSLTAFTGCLSIFKLPVILLWHELS